MRAWIYGLSMTVALLGLGVAAPAQAAGVPTYYTMFGGSNGTDLYLAVGLDSGDRRCTYGRTVRLQIKRADGWDTVATEVPTTSPVAGFRIPLTDKELRAQVPAKTLSDGTRCAAAKWLPSPPIRTSGSPHRAQTLIGPDIFPEVGLTTSVGTMMLVGEIRGVAPACRKGRTVKYTFDNGSTSGTLSKDVTGANGVYGVGGELPIGAQLFLKVPAKTVGDVECDSISQEISF